MTLLHKGAKVVRFLKFLFTLLPFKKSIARGFFIFTFMNRAALFILLSVGALLFSSCATIRSVSRPDVSKKEYAEMVEKDDPRYYSRQHSVL